MLAVCLAACEFVLSAQPPLMHSGVCHLSSVSNSASWRSMALSICVHVHVHICVHVTCASSYSSADHLLGASTLLDCSPDLSMCNSELAL